MEAKALIKAIGTLIVELERTRLVIVSHGARLEEFNHKTRHLKLDKKDAFVEMDAQAVRKDMRELLKEVQDLAAKFESLHSPSGASDGELRENVSRLLSNARSFSATVAGLAGNAQQTHYTLRSSHFGVLGWNIHHDAQEAETVAGHVVKICQRVFNGTAVE